MSGPEPETEPDIMDLRFEAWEPGALDEKYLTPEYLDCWVRDMGECAGLATDIMCKTQDELRVM